MKSCLLPAWAGALALCTFNVACPTALHAQATSQLSYLGNISPETDEWFWSPDWGWTFAYIQPQGDFLWTWDGQSWFWTSQQYFPYIFDYTGFDWLYAGTTPDGGHEWYFNDRTRFWEHNSLSEGDVQDLGTEAQQVVTDASIPSASIAIVSGNRLVAAGAAGMRQAGGSASVTTGDAYSVGTISQSMLATVAARLVAQGDIQWDTTLAQAFPVIGLTMDPAWKDVTLQQLLTHTGGAPFNLQDPASWRAKVTSGATQRVELVTQVTTQAPPYPAGSYHFSYVGYAMAAAMLEKASGETYDMLMQDALYTPQSLTTAGSGAATGDEPQGHTSTGTPVAAGPDAAFPVVLAPAADVHMSVPQLALYGALQTAGLHNAAEYGDASMFAPVQQPVATSPVNLTQGGWVMNEFTQLPDGNIASDGSNGLGYAIVIVSPETQLVGAAATNIYTPQAAKALRDALVAELQARMPQG